jgi:hypothetical protein
MRTCYSRRGGSGVDAAGGRLRRPIGINLTKSSSPSVGARVVEWGRVGLYGRPPWFACRRWLVDERPACPDGRPERTLLANERNTRVCPRPAALHFLYLSPAESQGSPRIPPAALAPIGIKLRMDEIICLSVIFNEMIVRWRNFVFTLTSIHHAISGVSRIRNCFGPVHEQQNRHLLPHECEALDTKCRF